MRHADTFSDGWSNAAGELCSKLEGRVQRALPELARALMGGSFCHAMTGCMRAYFLRIICTPHQTQCAMISYCAAATGRVTTLFLHPSSMVNTGPSAART